MGIYIKFNHYFFRREGATIFRETRRLISSLTKNEMFTSVHSLTCKYHAGLEKQVENLSNLSNFQEIFDAIGERYSRRGFYKYKLKSSIILFNEDGLKTVKIPVSIKLWRKARQKGHIAIEFDKNSYEFNSLFIGMKIWAKENKKNLINLIEGLNRERLGRYHTSLIAKINIGQKAFPFENVKEAFYIWRNTPESAYRDIMYFRQQLKRKYQGINIEDLPKQQKEKIRKIRDEMLKPYDLYYIPKKDLDSLTMNIVLKLTHLIDEYLKPKAIIKRGSYILMTPEGSPALLYPLLYDVNLKINKVHKIKIPTKTIMNEDVRKGFLEVFTTRIGYIEEIKKRGIALVGVLNQYIEKKMKEILELRPNWDDEGSKTYNEETFDRAKNFLITLMQDFLILYDLELEIPMLFPGIDGDIDIEWKNDKFQLLISIPEKKENLAGLYGSDYAEDEIEIDFDITKTNVRLLSWLKRQM